MMSYHYPHPISRTHRYKKVTKPLLERKRRARMNKCVEELKTLMIDALQTESQSISKLEKAEILELTVLHVQRLHAAQSFGGSSLSPDEGPTAESRWQSGFGQCAAEACKYLAALPGDSGEELARHLASGLESTRQLSSPIIPSDEVQCPTPERAEASPQLQTPTMPLSAQMAALSMNPEDAEKVCNPMENNEAPSIQIEEEEEIDVEAFEDIDPMWRPW